MKEKRGSNLYAGLMNIFAVILVAAIMAYGIADSYRITLDGYLGTQSSVTINDGDETDLYDYLSDYETADELVLPALKRQRQASGRGVEKCLGLKPVLEKRMDAGASRQKKRKEVIF